MPTTSARLARLPFYYGWIVVAVAFVTIGIGANARTSFSLLFPPMLDEFGWDRATTAAAFSLGFVSSTVISPLAGVLMDRYGPRLVMPFGAVMMASGLVLATWASQPWHLYLTLGVMVVGGSIFVSYIAHSMFLPNWFVRRRGLAIGLAFGGVGLGSIVLFPALQMLIERAGWRAACFALAVLLVVLIVPLNALLQRRHPEDLGLQPDGAARAGTSGASAPTNIVDAAWTTTDWTLGRAMKTARFWWISVGYFAGLYAWYAVQVHQTRYIVDSGFSAATAAYALGLVGLAGVGGQIGVGWLSDRFGREWAWSLACGGFAVCYLLLLVMQVRPDPVVMYLMVAAQGLLGYGLTSVFGAIPAELFQGKHFGTIFGVISLGAGLGAGAGPWVTGLLFDLTGSYASAFWVAAVMCAVSAACIWMAAPRKVRLVGGLAERRARARTA